MRGAGATTSGSSSKMGDVYYHSPAGKKVRSKPDVQRYLQKYMRELGDDKEVGPGMDVEEHMFNFNWKLMHSMRSQRASSSRALETLYD